MARSQMSSALTALVLALMCGVGSAVNDGIPRAPGTSTQLVPLGSHTQRLTGAAANGLPRIGSGVVQRAKFSFYADPRWDAQYAGRLEFWMGLGNGGCGYGNLLSSNKYPYLHAVALSGPTRAALGISSQTVGCGVCVRITCNSFYCKPGNPSVIAVVTDICPEFGGHSSGNVCHTNHVDGYVGMWNLVGKDSNPDVMIERVRCPSTNGNIRAYVMENRGMWQFLKLNFQDVGGAGLLTRVSMQCEGGEVVQLQNQYGAVWVTNNQPRRITNCRFTLTTDDGASLTSRAVTLKQGIMDSSQGTEWVDVVDLGVQFGAPSAPPTAPPKNPPTAPPKNPPPPPPKQTPPSSQLSNVAPDPWNSCENQARWGKCRESWMYAGNNPRCPPEHCCARSCAAARGTSTGRRLLSSA